MESADGPPVRGWTVPGNDTEWMGDVLSFRRGFWYDGGCAERRFM